VGTQRYRIKQGPAEYRDKTAAQGGSYLVSELQVALEYAGHGLNLGD